MVGRKVAAGHAMVPNLLPPLQPVSQVLGAAGPCSYLHREAPQSCPAGTAPWATQRSRLRLGCWHVPSCKKRAQPVSGLSPEGALSPGAQPATQLSYLPARWM